MDFLGALVLEPSLRKTGLSATQPGHLSHTGAPMVR